MYSKKRLMYVENDIYLENIAFILINIYIYIYTCLKRELFLVIPFKQVLMCLSSN